MKSLHSDKADGIAPDVIGLPTTHSSQMPASARAGALVVAAGQEGQDQDDEERGEASKPHGLASVKSAPIRRPATRATRGAIGIGSSWSRVPSDSSMVKAIRLRRCRCWHARHLS